MRLVTFDVETPIGTVQRLGCIRDATIVDLNLAYRDLLASTKGIPRAAAVADVVVPPDMLQFIETGSIAQEAAFAALTHADSLDASLSRRSIGTLVWDAESVRLAAPLRNPRSLREFGQFLGHATQGGRKQLAESWYEAPHYWKGNPSTIIGPEATIPWPKGVERLDFELEIACVIGRSGVDVDEADAFDYVFGFAIFNDVCARDIQSRELPAMKGPSKSHDFCSVMGPMLVAADELDLDRLVGRAMVNGEEWACASTEDMYFGWPTVIAHASRYDGIAPGDILVSGTFTGCSAIEHYDWADSVPLLRPGDVVELEIEGLGVLRNAVGERPEEVADTAAFNVSGLARQHRTGEGSY